MCVSLLLFRDVVVVFLSRNPNVSTPHNSSPERRAPFDKPQRFVSIVTRFAPFVDRSWAEGIRNLEKKILPKMDEGNSLSFFLIIYP
jgi:hypothetical protein